MAEEWSRSWVLGIFGALIVGSIAGIFTKLDRIETRMTSREVQEGIAISRMGNQELAGARAAADLATLRAQIVEVLTRIQAVESTERLVQDQVRRLERQRYKEIE